MGQTIISAGLIIIVTIAVINANRLVVTAETSKLESLARLQSADIAMALITEARMKKFDKNVKEDEYQSVDKFKSPNDLKRDGGVEDDFEYPDTAPFQSVGAFDDFDDYNDYHRTVTTSNISGYQVNCKVYYSTQSSPDIDANTQTYFKTLEVYVSHPQYLPSPIRISMTMSY